MTNKYKITIEIDMGPNSISECGLRDLAWEARTTIKEWLRADDCIISESAETIDTHTDWYAKLLNEELKEEV